MVLYIDLNAGRIYSTSLPLWLSILAQEQLYVRNCYFVRAELRLFTK